MWPCSAELLQDIIHLMAVLRCPNGRLYIVMAVLIRDVGDSSAHPAMCILWNKLSKRHRGLGRGFLRGIRKPSAILKHVSGADTKPFFLGLNVQPRVALAVSEGTLGPLRAVRR